MTITLPPEIFILPDLHVQSWHSRNGILTVTVRCRQHGAPCPGCGLLSTHVHGWYQRLVHDLPCQCFRVRVQADVRRFRCSNAACHRHTFAETLSIAS
jgi:transposase